MNIEAAFEEARPFNGELLARADGIGGYAEIAVIFYPKYLAFRAIQYCRYNKIGINRKRSMVFNLPSYFTNRR